jgi:hypothetical protein
MFKYISEILSKFNDRQRIIALIIVLFSIITISIAPKITELLTYDDSELQIRITNQNNEIIILNNRIGELSKQVVDNQRECVNEIIRRETEILSIINEIDVYARKTKNETRVIKSEPQFNRRIVSEDTVEVLMSSTHSPSTIIETTKRDETLIKMINNLKKKVSKDIEK